MAKRKTRICSVCRDSYQYCPSCAVDAHKPTWMFIFCCENCRSIYNTINDYRYNLLSKEDAAKNLKVLDLSCIDQLIPDFRQLVDEILLEDQPMMAAEEITTLIVENEQVQQEEKPVKIRKRKYTKLINEE